LSEATTATKIKILEDIQHKQIELTTAQNQLHLYAQEIQQATQEMHTLSGAIQTTDERTSQSGIKLQAE
jgi:hypothetical protein